MRRAFTLVEMITVVAIVAVLAAVAIPLLVEAQWKAKRAEVPTNVESIMDSQVAYVISYGDNIRAVAWLPTANGGKAASPWPTGTEFVKLGWQPDGDVRGQYQTNDSVVNACNTKTGHAGATVVYVAGRSDVDGDGIMFNYFNCDYDSVGEGFHERVSLSVSGYNRY